MAKVKAKKKTKKSKKAKTKTSKRVVGKNQLGVIQTWISLFQENTKKHQPDSAITMALQKNFVGRDSEIFKHVQSVRNRYNRGGLTKGVVPKIQSVRYDDEGNETTARGASKKASKKKTA